MPFRPSAIRLSTAVAALRRGGVVACPTEGVWGLSCDPCSGSAVHRLLRMKGRPASKGLILVAASEAQLDFLLSSLGPAERSELSASWPGPTTWLVPHRGTLPGWIVGEHDTVAVRVSSHPVVQALCRTWGGPLVSTSANPAGARPAMAAFQVRRFFGEQLDGLLPGAVGGSRRPSVIRDLASGNIIRP